ncbi:FAD-dependent monooxygenase [Shewanella sp. 5_MG-2023]|uniref:FAD-dependent monooxygenase n=1 Tax=unclassified Shewanella TaxID=196818 RepID=UPI0026E44341|nr:MULTISPECIES: FAD-dependent monooxygenase [unclassified Shewanella]MDO6638901.1 FAD-dependent monooxygenase [Shewanella sp. 5_MG-2023]MDO6773974.1 FAD-dependent monooxygenase [Shewanella sp. 3_MG-2023]
MHQASNVVEHDVVIVGGGMVGAAVAVGLGQLGLNVAMVEAFAPKAYLPEQPLDLRVSAISVASEQLLERLGVMEQLRTMRHVAYKGLETWELDDCITRFHADQIDESHLGYFFENRLIQLSLWQQIEKMDNVHCYCPDSVAKFERIEMSNSDVKSLSQGMKATLKSGVELHASLLVGADGANSQVRQWAGIGITGWDYAQSAMLINVETDTAQQDITWQQFTPQGPRSLLPLPGNNASLVWYDSNSRIKQLMQLNHKQLAEQIKLNFPSRLDENFTVIARGSFPLTRRHAQDYCQDNIVILGDAAHTINPLAGQGVNIGFKDVDVLIATIADAVGNDKPWWTASCLKQYQCKRYSDNLLMMSAMDAFYAGFSNDLLPIKLLRNGLLKLANYDNPIKQKVLKYALGLA